jgi:hypothetical protein
LRFAPDAPPAPPAAKPVPLSNADAAGFFFALADGESAASLTVDSDGNRLLVGVLRAAAAGGCELSLLAVALPAPPPAPPPPPPVRLTPWQADFDFMYSQRQHALLLPAELVRQLLRAAERDEALAGAAPRDALLPCLLAKVGDAHAWEDGASLFLLHPEAAGGGAGGGGGAAPATCLARAPTLDDAFATATRAPHAPEVLPSHLRYALFSPRTLELYVISQPAYLKATFPHAGVVDPEGKFGAHALHSLLVPVTPAEERAFAGAMLMR